jgi:hypothetical protein
VLSLAGSRSPPASPGSSTSWRTGTSAERWGLVFLGRHSVIGLLLPAGGGPGSTPRPFLARRARAPAASLAPGARGGRCCPSCSDTPDHVRKRHEACA